MLLFAALIWLALQYRELRRPAPLGRAARWPARTTASRAGRRLADRLYRSLRAFAAPHRRGCCSVSQPAGHHRCAAGRRGDHRPRRHDRELQRRRPGLPAPEAIGPRRQSRRAGPAARLRCADPRHAPATGIVEFASPFNDERRLEARRIVIDGRKALILVRDVTQLNRLLTMRQDFVANVSHELRTPLTVVVGYLETMAGEEPSIWHGAGAARKLEAPTRACARWWTTCCCCPGWRRARPLNPRSSTPSTCSRSSAAASPKRRC
jgi:hypothetical protein